MDSMYYQVQNLVYVILKKSGNVKSQIVKVASKTNGSVIHVLKDIILADTKTNHMESV